jgi:hypothetical protein
MSSLSNDTIDQAIAETRQEFERILDPPRRLEIIAFLMRMAQSVDSPRLLRGCLMLLGEQVPRLEKLCDQVDAIHAAAAKKADRA